MAKSGNPEDRAACAKFARDARAKFPELKGGFTRREWNLQVFVATKNRLTRLTRARVMAEPTRSPRLTADAMNHLEQQ